MSDVSSEWLRSIGFLPDGDSPEREEFGRTVAGWDGGDPNEEHVQIVVCLPEQTIYLEDYDDAGQTTSMIKVPGWSREKIVACLALFDVAATESPLKNEPQMKCTRCQGTGFLNIDQLPHGIDANNPEAVLQWLKDHEAKWRGCGCSCHINPPCSYCIDQHDISVCDCCGDGTTHYGTPGQHYGSDDPKGLNGPYAKNGGLCQCH